MCISKLIYSGCKTLLPWWRFALPKCFLVNYSAFKLGTVSAQFVSARCAAAQLMCPENNTIYCAARLLTNIFFWSLWFSPILPSTYVFNNKIPACTHDVTRHVTAALSIVIIVTRRALGAHVPPTKVFPRLAMNKTILKTRVAAATGALYLYVGFSRRNKILRCSAYDIG